MTTMSNEELSTALATLTQLVSQMVSSEQGRRGGDKDVVGGTTTSKARSKKLFEQKTFTTLDKFDGSAEKFQDWSYQLRMLTKSESEEFYSKLLETERAKDEVCTSDLEDQCVGEEMPIRQASTEFFQILATHLQGEPLTLVRGVQDMNGLEAWRLLVRRFEPSSKSRMFASIMSILDVKRNVAKCDFANTLSAWELQVKNYEAIFKKTLDEDLKISASLMMAPPDIRQLLLQKGDRVDSYKDVREMYSVFLENMVHEPNPRDIHSVDYEHFTYQSAEEVNAINGACYQCGNWGHPARECPMSKGKSKGKGEGKAGKGKGQWNPNGPPTYLQAASKGAWNSGSLPPAGMSKGKAKGNGKPGGKPGGNPYLGACWRCNQVGHQAWQCVNQIAWVSDGLDSNKETAPLQSAEIAGAVWELNAVICERTVEPPNKKGREIPVRLRNQYAALGQDEEDDDHITFIGPVMEMPKHTEPSQPKPKKAKFKKEGRGFITLDSGAEESVWPQSWLPSIPTKPASVERKFAAANGTRLKHYGEKVVPFQTNDSAIASVKFQVTDVIKPLVSVKRIIERGNSVVRCHRRRMFHTEHFVWQAD
jgi:hypothetical protein